MVCSSEQRFDFGSQVSEPLNLKAGERRIMRPTTDADSTVATRNKTPTAG